MDQQHDAGLAIAERSLVLPEGVSRSSRVESRETRTGKGFRLGPVMPLGSLADRRIKAGAGEAEDTADGQAQVQDTEDSLEVIIVMLRAVPALVVPELRNRRPALARQTHPLLDRIPVVPVYMNA